MKIKQVISMMLVVLTLMVTASCAQESLTEGDRVAWERYCSEFSDDQIRQMMCNSRLDDIEAAIESGWSKDCAIQWHKADLQGIKPDPYRCE